MQSHDPIDTIKLLLERNETRRVGSTNTGSTVLDGVAREQTLVPWEMGVIDGRDQTY